MVDKSDRERLRKVIRCEKKLVFIIKELLYSLILSILSDVTRRKNMSLLYHRVLITRWRNIIPVLITVL